jgi:hypothetical protein
VSIFGVSLGVSSCEAVSWLWFVSGHSFNWGTIRLRSSYLSLLSAIIKRRACKLSIDIANARGQASSFQLEVHRLYTGLRAERHSKFSLLVRSARDDPIPTLTNIGAHEKQNNEQGYLKINCIDSGPGLHSEIQLK